MTLTTLAPAPAGRRPAPGRTVATGPALAVAAGMAVLLARPWLARRTADPTAVLVSAFVCIGMAGAWCRLAPDRAPLPSRRVAVLVLAAGVVAFVAGRVLGGGEAPVPVLAGYLALNTLAAVAEEALFRRLLYGLLEPWGPTVAIAGSAAAFALVHLTVWGAWVLPIDLAAGLVLSWQRWASGRWTVPAATHVVANVLVVV